MASELRGFVFALSFIVIFAALLTAVPTYFQGTGNEVELIAPVNPALIGEWSETEELNKSDFVGVPPLTIVYIYTLQTDGWDWTAGKSLTAFSLAAKVYLGPLWLGGYASVSFTAEDSENLGGELTFDEIDTKADNGTAIFSLAFINNGNDAGDFVFYWNTTDYSDSSSAWTADALYLIHGVGFGSMATNNIGALVVSLLLIQLPDVPPLINVLLAVPIWAAVVFILWFIIKEMIPFV